MEKELNTIDLEKPFEWCEWCFQFGNEEPIILASQSHVGDDKMVIEFGNTPGANIVFTSKNGQQFKIFARESLNHEDKNKKTN